MKLDGLTRFYKRVKPKALEAYLRAHTNYAYVERTPGFGGEQHYQHVRGQRFWIGVCSVEQVKENVRRMAVAELRQPTAVLFDLLPASARPDFVREILPQVAK